MRRRRKRSVVRNRQCGYCGHPIKSHTFGTSTAPDRNERSSSTVLSMECIDCAEGSRYARYCLIIPVRDIPAIGAHGYEQPVHLPIWNARLDVMATGNREDRAVKRVYEVGV